MGPFRKYMVLESNFMKSENQFLMWKIIYFLCTLSRLHILCQDCPFFPPVPIIHLFLSPQWNRPTLCWRHHRPPPLSLSLSLPSFSLFPSFLKSPREKKAVAMVENQGWREEGATSCHWWWQLATLVVIDGGDDKSTSIGERWALPRGEHHRYCKIQIQSIKNPNSEAKQNTH